MFNSLDPSPLWDRDLDRGAAEFIEEEFSEKRSAGVWHLHVHAQENTALAADLQAAVQNYYTRLAVSARRQLQEHLWMGQLSLLGGAFIFIVSMSARGILQKVFGVLSPVLNEGFIILAWLALWRPAEALLYEWIPFYRKRRLFERLAGIQLLVRSDAVAAGETHVGAAPPRTAAGQPHPGTPHPGPAQPHAARPGAASTRAAAPTRAPESR